MSDNRPGVYFEGDLMVVRASALLHCTRSLAALATGYDAMATPQSMQDRFDDGNLHEAGIVSKIAAEFDVEIDTVTPEGEQWVFQLPIHRNLVIRGSVDGVVKNRLDESLIHVIAEAKSMSDSMFGKWLRGGFKDFPGYAYQISAYLLASRATKAYYGVKNKNSGRCDFQVIYTPPIDKITLFTRALAIEKAVKQAKSGEIDAAKQTCDKPMFPCAVYYLHEEKVEKVAVEDHVLLNLVKNYNRLREEEAAAAESKSAVAEEIKMRMEAMGQDAADVQGWQITCKPGGANRTNNTRLKEFVESHGASLDDFKEYKPNSTPTLTVTPPKLG